MWVLGPFGPVLPGFQSEEGPAAQGFAQADADVSYSRLQEVGLWTRHESCFLLLVSSSSDGHFRVIPVSTARCTSMKGLPWWFVSV